MGLVEPHTLEKLEFARVAELLSGYARSSLGRQLALRVRPITSDKRVRYWLGQVREMQEIAQGQGLPPYGGVTDVRPHVRGAVLPHKLEPEALGRIADTLAATHQIRQWAAELPEVGDG